MNTVFALASDLFDPITIEGLYELFKEQSNTRALSLQMATEFLEQSVETGN